LITYFSTPMPLLTSKYRKGLDNLSVDMSRVTKVQFKTPCPNNPRLWVTYFWGMDENQKEKVVRTWFYNSQQEWETELARIQEKYPSISIV